MASRGAVGLTMTAGALGVWGLWLELWYLRPFWRVLVADYGWYIGAHAGLALVTVAAGVYVASRSVSLVQTTIDPDTLQLASAGGWTSTTDAGPTRRSTTGRRPRRILTTGLTGARGYAPVPVSPRSLES